MGEGHSGLGEGPGVGEESSGWGRDPQGGQELNPGVDSAWGEDTEMLIRE